MEERDERVEKKLDTFQVELKALRMENQEIKRVNTELQRQVENQDKRIMQMEKEIRKRNIVIYGVDEPKEENIQYMKCKVSQIMNKLEVQIDEKGDILDIYRIGRPTGNNSRPLLVETKSWNKKMEILKETRKLKGTKIFISEDFPKDIQEQRRILTRHMKDAREKGHKVKLYYNTLKIDEGMYNVESLGYRKNHFSSTNSNSTDVNYAIVEKPRGRTMSQRSPNEDSNEWERIQKITKTSSRTGTIPKNLELM